MCAEETWRILISDDVSGGGAGAAQGGGGEDDATIQSRTKQAQENFNQLFGWFKPFVVVGGIFYMLYQHSQIVSTVMGTIGKILGAIMDVILLPLMPLFVAVVNAIVPLIPIIQKLSEAFFKPIVDFLVVKVNNFANWMMDEVNWDNLERWLRRAGETVTTWLQTVYDWLSGPFYHWWCDHAYPWLVKKWQEFYIWITNLDWGQLWRNVATVISVLVGLAALFITFQVTLFAFLAIAFAAVVSAAGANTPWGAAVAVVGNTAIAAAAITIGVGLLAGALTAQRLGLQTGGQIYTEGNYHLHAGERVINENDNKYGSGSGGGVAMTNTFNIELALTGTVDDLAREVEAKITERLTNIMRRA
jgi:hypothetical protein